jgi:hypothetical protein
MAVIDLNLVALLLRQPLSVVRPRYRVQPLSHKSRGGDGKVKRLAFNGRFWHQILIFQSLPIFTNLYHSLPLFTNLYQSLQSFSLRQLFSLFFTSQVEEAKNISRESALALTLLFCRRRLLYCIPPSTPSLSPLPPLVRIQTIHQSPAQTPPSPPPPSSITTATTSINNTRLRHGTMHAAGSSPHYLMKLPPVFFKKHPHN